MQLREKVFFIIILIIVILSAVGLRLIQTSKEVETDLATGVSQYLLDYEFTDICIAWDQIYCSGVDGLFVINPKTNESRLIDSDLRYVRALEYHEASDVLWVGHSRGIAIYNGYEFITSHYIEGIDDAINDIVVTDNDQFYIAAFKGIYVVEESTIVKQFSVDQGLLDNMVNRLLLDEQGNIWFGTYVGKGGGIGIIKDGLVKQTFQLEDGLVHDAITSITQFSKTEILIGGGVYTVGGANIISFEDNEWVIKESITLEDGLAGEKVRHIYIDTSERIWFCSEYDGIAIFSDLGVAKKIITIADGLSDNEVKKIIEDDLGNLWMASRRGITKFNKGVLIF